MKIYNPVTNEDKSSLNFKDEEQSVPSVQNTLLLLWGASLVSAILSAFYGLGNQTSWIVWALVTSLTVASVTSAIGTKYFKLNKPQYRNAALHAAWLSIVAILLILMVVSENWTFAWIASVPCIMGWHCSILLLDSPDNSSATQEVKIKSIIRDKISSAVRHVQKKVNAVMPTRSNPANDVIDTAPLQRHWIDELLKTSMRIKPIATIIRGEGNSVAADEIDNQILKIRSIHGQLKSMAYLNSQPRGEVRFTQVLELIMEPLAEQARQHNVKFSRPTPVVLPSVYESTSKVSMGFYHLILGAIESCSARSSRTVSVSLLGADEKAVFRVHTPTDPTQNQNYQKAIALLDSTKAKVSVSTDDQGVSIELAFPAEFPRSRTTLCPVQSRSPVEAIHAQTTMQTYKSLRVLFVDDEPEVCNLAEELLGMRHASVDTATSLEQVERLLSLHTYDVAILDIYMPKTSGLEIYERIKELAPRLAEKTVFCTGAVLGDHVERYINDNGLSIIQKPFDSSALARAIRATVQAEEETTSEYCRVDTLAPDGTVGSNGNGVHHSQSSRLARFETKA